MSGGRYTGEFGIDAVKPGHGHRLHPHLGRLFLAAVMDFLLPSAHELGGATTDDHRLGTGSSVETQSPT